MVKFLKFPKFTKAFRLEERRRFIIGYFFLLPFFVFIATFWIKPLIDSIWLSFNDVKYTFENMRFVGLDNYIKIFTKDIYVPDVIFTTVLYVGTVILINAFYSFIIAFVTTYYIKNEALGTALRLLWLIPRIMPTIVYAVMWLWLIDPEYGPINMFMRFLGLKPPESWLIQRPYSWILMIIVNGFVGASWGMIIYSAAIKSLPLDIIYAAKVDGASEFQILRYIFIPLLKWPILFVTAWQTLSLLSSFGEILAIWGEYAVARAGQVVTWALYAWFKAFYVNDFGYGAALSMVLVVIGIALVLLYFKIFGYRRLTQPSRVEV